MATKKGSSSTSGSLVELVLIVNEWKVLKCLVKTNALIAIAGLAALFVFGGGLG